MRPGSNRGLWRVRLAGLLIVAALPCAQLIAQKPQPVANGRVLSGTLSFDGHATAGDFTGTTRTVSGQLIGSPDLTGVRGWVESPVKTLKTGNNKRDRDLNKSLESEKYPVLRFDLLRVARRGSSDDSLGVLLYGNLSIHGVTRSVELPATVQLRGSTTRLRSDFPLNLKHYKIGGLSKLLGMLRMYEDIEVHVDLVFGPEPEKHGNSPAPYRPPGSPSAGGAVGLRTADFYRSTLRRPSRDTTTVREIEPRLSRRLALESPRLMPSGANVKRRVGPSKVTRLAAGPGSVQRAAPPLRGEMLSRLESTERVSTWPRVMAMTRAR